VTPERTANAAFVAKEWQRTGAAFFSATVATLVGDRADRVAIA